MPTNPLFLVPPLPLIAKIVHSIPKENRPLVVVDSTFLSPFYCAPLIPCGDALPMADVVLTSLSKYSGGHSDLILGSLTVSPRTVQAKPHLLKGLRFLQNSFGATASPRDCHLMVRSLKTLSVRALKHGLNALQIAAWLDTRPEVEDVKYVGLKSSKAFHMVTHLLSANAKRELEYLGWEFPYVVAETKGTPGTLAHTKTLGVPFGGMIGFRLKGASEAQTEAFMLRLRLVSLAESLGGVESLIEAPYGMTHAVSGFGFVELMLVSARRCSRRTRYHTQPRPTVGGDRGRVRPHRGSQAGVQSVGVRLGASSRTCAYVDFVAG